MASRLKQYLLLAAAGAALYFLLTHHIVFHGEDANFVKNIYFLKKSKLDLNETFVSLNQKSPDAIMKVKVLRDNGIGGLMVEIGMITDAERHRLESKYR